MLPPGSVSAASRLLSSPPPGLPAICRPPNCCWLAKPPPAAGAVSGASDLVGEYDLCGEDRDAAGVNRRELLKASTVTINSSCRDPYVCTCGEDRMVRPSSVLHVPVSGSNLRLPVAVSPPLA